MTANPFPGLRPFREGEEALFFGREAQVDAMIDKLAATHFLAVVGTSGSGKSSLVNCGLVPALHRGLMASAGSQWRVASLRPGNRPLRALAQALARPGLLVPAQADDTSGFTPAELMEATLRMSKLGLVDAYEQAHLDAQQNLLVVVDQFEELFRYQALAASAVSATTAGAAALPNGNEDATAFVNLLVEVAARPDLPVYVVLTMRSDFLGDCAQYFGLPEAINRGQYLVPRMTREERRAAITGPVGVSGAQIDPVLATRLVNDVGDDPDQLSILQHALNRTWSRWQSEGGAGPLALSHYEAVGTMARALDEHAEEAWAALTGPAQQALCAALFKAITDKGTDARGTRRPTRMDTLVAITGASADEIGAVVEIFREPARSFLMPPAGAALAPDTPVDIAHESLMRVWRRLRTWVDEEAQSAQTYRRLAETAELHAAGRAGLLRPPDLPAALGWREREKPGAAWAQRYRPGFAAAMDFLQRSQQAYDDELRNAQAAGAEREQLVQQQTRTRRLLRVAMGAGGVLVVLFSLMWLLYSDARHERQRADRETIRATAAAASSAAAEVQARAAQTRAEEALLAARRATDSQQKQSEVYAQALGDRPQLRQQIQQAVRSKRSVYLQYTDGAQGPAVEKLRPHLAQAGYSAPGSEKVQNAPASAELRYFRSEDAAEARSLTELFKSWSWGAVRPAYVKGYEGQSQIRQFELWLARANPIEMARLLQAIDAPGKDDRLHAVQALIDGWSASPTAIAGVLALLAPAHIEAMSAPGRYNALFYLTRTAPLAWDDGLAATASEMIQRARSRRDMGKDSQDELGRLERLLAAAKAGAAAGPAN